MKYIFVFSIILLFACDSEDVTTKIFIPASGENGLNFESSLETVFEGQNIQVNLDFDRATSEDGFIEITYTTDDAVYGENFNTLPDFTNNLLRIDYSKGSESISFNFQSLTDENAINESIDFSITSASPPLKYNSSSIIKINIEDDAHNALVFESTLEMVTEGESFQVNLNFDMPTLSEGFIDISYTSDNAVYGENFITQPSFTNEVLKVNFSAGTESISFNFQSIVDDNTVNESVEFSISQASLSIQFSSNSVLKLNIQDETEDTANDDNLTVVTWNIEHFPKNGAATINAVKDIVLNMDADIIALQEMDDIDAFNTLVDAIDGWEGALYDVRGGIEIAYLYKSSEITAFSNLSIIFPDDRNAFPRQPVLATATHSNGLEITLINVHLKCCGVTGSDDANRRESASIALQEYINTNLANDNVIVVGDWNDDIGDGPFDNFLADSDNYVFADFDIGNGSSANWSYPSWPSHLDHILITNELTDNLISTETLRLDVEVSGYTSNVSDHRPVAATFTN